jgi:hypothetical protein
MSSSGSWRSDADDGALDSGQVSRAAVPLLLNAWSRPFDAGADGRWWSQLIPFYGLVGLARLAGRLNAALAAVRSPTRVGVTTTWLWATFWFDSQTRYVQRRLNIVHDIQASKMMTVEV